MALIDTYKTWLSKCEERMNYMHSYDCPHCGFATMTVAPINNDVWDTLCACPACENLNFKVVTFSGVEVTAANE